MENDTGTTISVISILKWKGGIIASVVVGLTDYSVSTFRARLKTIEKKQSDLELKFAVHGNSFTEYKVYKNKMDEELSILLTEIKTNIGKVFDKIDSIKTDFDLKFAAINKTIAGLQIENAKNKNGK